jgi:hypothetical protein
MLKITYLEEGINLEYLEESLEVWKADRILVNLRAGVSVHVESSIANIVLAMNSGIHNLLQLAQNQPIELVPCDEEYLEVGLLGTWIAQRRDSEEGIFVCELSPEIESCLYRLWIASQAGASVIN